VTDGFERSVPGDRDNGDDRDDGGRGDGEGEVGDDASATSGQRESGGPSEEGFADAFGAGGRAGGSGSAGSGDGPGEYEDEAAVDSAIPRVDLGIEGLDAMVRGGIPKRSLIAVIGSAGTGKTTVGLQFLRQALHNDEKAIFIALEEGREAVLDTAAEKGWAFERYYEGNELAVVDVDPIETATSLRGIRSELPRLIAEFGASRVVLDSVSLLETMYDDPAKRRTEIFAFARSLKEAGVTTLLTSEAATESAYASRYGIVEYLTDRGRSSVRPALRLPGDQTRRRDPENPQCRSLSGDQTLRDHRRRNRRLPAGELLSAPSAKVFARVIREALRAFFQRRNRSFPA
jgi:KaiC domain protein